MARGSMVLLLLLGCHAPQLGSGESLISGSLLEDLRRGDAGLGRSLFTKVWAPGERAPAGGDGLGPAFNDTSCVGCHSQGGVGGAGPAAKNAQLWAKGSSTQALPRRGTSVAFTEWRRGVLDGLNDGPGVPFWKRSVVLERNTPALFGAGVVDRISDAAIKKAAAVQRNDDGPVNGVVGFDRHGEIGRFGWKADVADLGTFVNQACANEMGLTTPTQLQLQAPGARTGPTGFDLTQHDVDSMTAFIAELPVPVSPETADGDPAHHLGEDVFEQVGCAECHLPALDGVEGLYSDLLLHEMGAGLSERVGAAYYGQGGRTVARRASGSEWRTPPLWGVGTSGPWLHDGRAETLTDAILAHDGEARASREAFRARSASERELLVEFLETLRAP